MVCIWYMLCGSVWYNTMVYLLCFVFCYHRSAALPLLPAVLYYVCDLDIIIVTQKMMVEVMVTIIIVMW